MKANQVKQPETPFEGFREVARCKRFQMYKNTNGDAVIYRGGFVIKAGREYDVNQHWLKLKSEIEKAPS